MASQATSTSEVHDEDVEIVEKLAKLQQMHEQIFELRTLLPNKLLGPARESIKEPHRVPPQKLANTISQAARKGASDIKQFKKDWHDEKTREIFQNASSAEVPQGVDAWMVDYTSLLTSKTGTSVTEAIATNTSESQDDPVKLLNQFKEANSGIKVTTAGDADPFPVLLEFSGLAFQVSKTSSASFAISPKVDSNNRLVQKIVDQIAKSDANSNIKQLLNMIASYQDVRTRCCDKCEELYDADMELPIVRKPVSNSSTEEKGTSWAALHSNCG